MAGFAMTKLDKKRNISQVTDNVSMPGTLYSTLSLESFLLGVLPSSRSPPLCTRSYHPERIRYPRRETSV